MRAVWEIVGKLGPHARSGYDASGWLWEIERGDEAKRVLVEVTGTAHATAKEWLPRETAEAIETEGESEVSKILALDDPPRVISCGTMGCRHVLASELGG